MSKKKENENSRVETNSDGEKISLKREKLEAKLGIMGKITFIKRWRGGGR